MIQNSFYHISGGNQIHNSLEVINQGEIDKHGGQNNFDKTGIYGMDRSELMPSCPQPNVTYNGSLLSSGKVNTISRPGKEFIFTKKVTINLLLT